MLFTPLYTVHVVDSEFCYKTLTKVIILACLLSFFFSSLKEFCKARVNEGVTITTEF